MRYNICIYLYMKTNYLRHDQFYYFKLSETFPIVKNTAHNIMLTFLIKYL